jgi:hypothetical protein
MDSNQTYNPYEIISGHFYDIKNEIDIRIEELLEKSLFDKTLSNKLNILRDKQIKKIDEIKSLNLCRIQFDEDEYTNNWSFLLNDSTIDYEQKAEIFKENLILNDCLLIEDAQCASNLMLWITPWYFNKFSSNYLK